VDYKTFIAEIVKALAWPVTVLGIVYILKQPLARVILTLTKLKYKDLELEFEDKLQDAKKEAERANLPPSPLLAAVTKDTYLELATHSPREAILEAFSEVLDAALETAKRHGLAGTQSSLKDSPMALIRLLRNAGVLDAQQELVFKQLRVLRNDAYDSPTFALTAASAIQYVTLAKRLADYLRAKSPTPSAAGQDQPS
jgi:hypothetical protein